MNKIYETTPPMPTRYKGVNFRSRTEARWAVFFDALGIEWQYEPEYFRLSDGEFYKPDFYLPRLDHPVYSKGLDCAQTDSSIGLYVEVKPRGATPDMFDKAVQFSKDHAKSVLLLDGGPRAAEFRISYGRAETWDSHSVAMFKSEYLPGGGHEIEYRLWHDQDGCWEPDEIKECFAPGIAHALAAVSAAVFDEYDGVPPGNECSVYRNAAVQNQPRC